MFQFYEPFSSRPWIVLLENILKEIKKDLLEEDSYENTYHIDEYDGVYIFTKEPILKEGGPYKKYAISLRESLYINKDDEKQKCVPFLEFWLILSNV